MFAAVILLYTIVCFEGDVCIVENNIDCIYSAFLEIIVNLYFIGHK